MQVIMTRIKMALDNVTAVLMIDAALRVRILNNIW